ncbi:MULTISPECIES: DUF1127 domain-containing protein [unclassified Mesorhizobium]|uniref:DUF1127 domain-containing protein n=1 Tax=unclassified Mesorhizobium TaxID=325217 RepID=UPI00112C8461|nr:MULTISPECIES: DUF1127 domain-containing protein [unclassified Mesorhizobium]TPN55009.1 DUF1127 domain-containing protein [Mesorhizobium sp. B1-1-7]TPN55512.1 DUF1127 domain-containing protein [Mesorhizobium sp. B1-1-9]
MRPDHSIAQRLAGHVAAPTVRTETFRQSLHAQCLAAARWVGRQMEKRRSRIALLEMTDEQLKDIGLSRGDAYCEFRRRLWD